MQLYYWKTHPNFGDQLNPWMWPRIFPDLFDDDDRDLFLGIGTVLWSWHPKAPYKHVFGAGCGIGNRPVIDDKWLFHFVRGPHTAQAFGLPPSKAITDPAMLIHTLYHPMPAKRFKISFMPHFSHATNHKLDALCQRYEIHYISPITTDVESVINEIAASELVIAEAMHGAIVADALRVPWVPVDIYGVNYFKWQDWCDSLAVAYNPMRWIKRLPNGSKLRDKIMRNPTLSNIYTKLIFRHMVKNPRACLSSDTAFHHTLGRLVDAVETYRKTDYYRATSYQPMHL